ncbi:MAG: VanW family protein [Patescibacteria group bacterium]
MRKVSASIIGAALVAAPFFVMSAVNWNAIAYGVSVDGMDIGAKKVPEAKAVLDDHFARTHETELPFTAGDIAHRATVRNTGILLSADKTAEHAYAIGRSNAVARNMLAFVRAATLGTPTKSIAVVDETRFTAFINETFGTLEHPAQNATVVYDSVTERFIPTQEKAGIVIDRAQLTKDILSAARTLESATIAVAMRNDEPRVVLAAAVAAAHEANALLEKTPVITTYQRIPGLPSSTTRFPIEKAQLAEMVGFVPNNGALAPDIDEQALTDWLVQIAPAINENPQNATLAVRDGRVEEFSLSRDGHELDVPQSARGIKNSILFGSADPIPLVVTTLHPLISSDTIDNLGITGLLAVGESDFAGSSSARVFNLTLGAKKMNGVIIAPNEEFSFVETIGEIGSAEGYQAGLVIKGNKTVPEYGGGICQVSTTMFRAAIHAGLRITERFPHSLPVQYYNPQGFDATVYGPHPDLRFVNDTGSNILVQTKIKGTKLVFEFYGRPDGRTVTVIGPEEYDKKPDGSLKAKLIREIYRDGTLVTSDVFKSSYRSPIVNAVQRNPLE